MLLEDNDAVVMNDAEFIRELCKQRIDSLDIEPVTAVIAFTLSFRLQSVNDI